MKKYILLAMLGLSTYMYSSTAYAQEACVAGTEVDFEAYVAKENWEMFTLTPEGVQKYLAYLNAKRAEQGPWALEGDKFSFAIVQRDENDFRKSLVGIVMFKDGCVVPGTVLVVELGDFVDFLTAAGIRNEIQGVLHI